MRFSAGLPAALVACLALANCAPAMEAAAPEVSRAATSAASEPLPSQPDLACLAEAIYFEAGPGAPGAAAVAHVVVNRARDPRFPRTVCGVISDKCQFSYRCDGKPLALRDPARRANAHRVAEAVLSGAPDPTRGALFFHSARVSPSWFQTRSRTGEFGGNVFYR